LVGAFQLGQLQGAVHTRHLQGVVDAVGRHAPAIGHGHGDDVGQVVLALGVVVGQAREPGFEQARRHGHDAAVDFIDGALGFARVLVLDDARHLSCAIAQDAAVARGVGQAHGQQRQLPAGHGLRGRHQRAQRGRLRQRHVAREHDHRAVVRQARHGLLHGVAGAQLRLLAHTFHVKLACNARQSCGSRFYFCSAVAGDDDGAARLQVRRLVQHMVQQRTACEALQDLGGAAFHARALAGRHDEDVEWSHESKSVGGRSGQPPRGLPPIIGAGPPRVGPLCQQ
jgi:hypothetical protein